ncbi:phage head closure protein [Enterococcus diestrammenae]|uniref:Phage head-tail adaptor n=1 Tax=Enterococcus diestrammenae TaxID=1155073 RepID=A0ABV0F1T3_9ENTE|nr:phage head closure protein [Enterococcus diestrammenae]KAF1294802.1 phage head-tail joining protein [Enterococcus diestrammenae]
MPKRQTNNLRWKADLMSLSSEKGSNDRPVVVRKRERLIVYEPVGITSNEKYLAMQAKTDVDFRMKCRWDPLVNEKDFGIRIKNVDYNIVRIYVLPDQREMELSLSRVD